MFSSLIKATVPVVLFGTQIVLAQDSCSVKHDVSYTVYGLSSAGSMSKWGCDGETKIDTQGAMVNSGDGSYGNPAQMATALANKDFKQCHVYYVPFLKKYFRYTDECVAADNGYPHGQVIVDLWIGDNPTDANNIPNSHNNTCASLWGARGPYDIVVDAGPGLPTQLANLDPTGGTCLAPPIGVNTDTQHFFPSNPGSCSGSSGGNTGGSPASQAAPPASSAPSFVGNPGGSPTNQAALSPSPVGNPNGNPTTQPFLPPSPSPSLQANANYQVKAADPANSLPPPSSDTPTTLASIIAPSGGPSGGGGTGAYSAPPGQWTPGMIYGSGPGMIGDACTAKTDCHGDFICIGGKCHDNRTDKVRRAGAGGHGHGLLRGVHARRV